TGVLLVRPGPARVSVVFPYTTLFRSVPVTVTADPVITSVVGTPIPAGIGNTSIDVYGLNISANSVVQWNGTALSTALLSAADGRLREQVPEAQAASPVAGRVTLVNTG